MIRAALAGGVMMVAVLGAGCRKPSTPEQAYSAYAAAVEKQDGKAAFRALSGRVRGELERRAEEVAKASGGALEADAAALALSFTGRHSGVTKVSTVSVEGERAVVEVVIAGKSERVPLVREQGSWKLDPPIEK